MSGYTKALAEGDTREKRVCIEDRAEERARGSELEFVSICLFGHFC